ncbi:cardiac phospholamban [Hemitrygon akajei]|uniref:cardiac phospholamban n=1 Tax=Hemitrygon akajei TaxID=2704970 RepID=UPI003BF9BEC0
MDKVQQITSSALRRASAIDVNPQDRQKLHGLLINFILIVGCLLFIYVVKLLMF